MSEPRRMANVLRRALAELTTEEGPVVGAVPGYQSSLQSLSLPRARGMDPSVVIPREARRRMGVSAERSHLVWHRLVDGIGVTNWLVLSASRRSVASISTMAGTAGLRVHSFELRPFALARAVDQPEAIIAWTAADGCEVSIVRDWVPVATQTAYWGATPPVEGDILVNRITEVVERALVICEQESLDSSLPDDTPIYVTGSPLSLEPKVVKIRIKATHPQKFRLFSDQLIFQVAGTPSPSFFRDYLIETDPFLETGIYVSGGFSSLAVDDTDYYRVRESGDVVQWTAVSQAINLGTVSSVQFFFTARVSRGTPVQQIYVFNPANGGDGYAVSPDSETTYGSTGTDVTVSFLLSAADVAYVNTLFPKEVRIRVRGTDSSNRWRLNGDRLVFRVKP